MAEKKEKKGLFRAAYGILGKIVHTDGDDYIIEEKFEEACKLLEQNNKSELLLLLDQYDRLALFQDNKNGSSLLHNCVLGLHDVEVPQKLIDLRADVNVCDFDNRTPLMDAVRQAAPIEIIKCLLDAGANADCSSVGRSIIHYASRGLEGNFPVLQLLLDSIDVSKVADAVNRILDDTVVCRTALDYAQNPDICELLRNYGALTGREKMAQLRNFVELSKVADNLLKNGFKPKYPCVLLPGTCSSSLKVYKSESKPEWIGTRIWIDALKLGIKLGLKHKAAEDVAFLEHMRLLDDGISDPPGVCVRPVEGIGAIDYLMDTGLSVIKKQSIVWGEVIDILHKIGYTSANMVGFPYDWRLAPAALHERDKILIKLQKTIEYLKSVKDEKVALIGHSQGCKFGQYFLHWAEDNLGRPWIDEHVQTFLALGPPWSGAPKCVRALISGDSMGLPTYILFGDRFMVALSRSFSSSHWLLPFGEDGNCIHLKPENEEEYKQGHWREHLSQYDETFNYFYEKYYQNSLLYNSEKEEEIRGLSAPYVPSIHCIYGVNSKEVPNYSGEPGTEVGAYYEERKHKITVGNKIISMKLHKFSDPRPGERHFVKDGIVKERPLDGFPSGDGTVSYESLSWAKKWMGKPDSPVIKHYEFEGVPHRETILEPSVLFLIGEILCGGNPKEVHFCSSNEQKTETIYTKPAEYIFEHLSDKDGVPYIVSCIISSLYATNAVGIDGILRKQGVEEDVEYWGTVFLTHKEPIHEELVNVYPHTRIQILKNFLFELGVPLLNIDSNGKLQELEHYIILDNPVENVNLQNLLKNIVESNSKAKLTKCLLEFFKRVISNPKNDISIEDIAFEFGGLFIWHTRETSSFFRVTNIITKVLVLKYDEMFNEEN